MLESLPAIDGQKRMESKDENMELGAFSISLAVKDFGASPAFYETFR